MPCSCQRTAMDESACTDPLLHYAKHSFDALKVPSGPNLGVPEGLCICSL